MRPPPRPGSPHWGGYSRDPHPPLSRPAGPRRLAAPRRDFPVAPRVSASPRRGGVGPRNEAARVGRSGRAVGPQEGGGRAHGGWWWAPPSSRHCSPGPGRSRRRIKKKRREPPHAPRIVEASRVCARWGGGKRAGWWWWWCGGTVRPSESPVAWWPGTGHRRRQRPPPGRGRPRPRRASTWPHRKSHPVGRGRGFCRVSLRRGNRVARNVPPAVAQTLGGRLPRSLSRGIYFLVCGKLPAVGWYWYRGVQPTMGLPRWAAPPRLVSPTRMVWGGGGRRAGESTDGLSMARLWRERGRGRAMMGRLAQRTLPGLGAGGGHRTPARVHEGAPLAGRGLSGSPNRGSIAMARRPSTADGRACEMRLWRAAWGGPDGHPPHPCGRRGCCRGRRCPRVGLFESTGGDACGWSTLLTAADGPSERQRPRQTPRMADVHLQIELGEAVVARAH